MKRSRVLKRLGEILQEFVQDCSAYSLKEHAHLLAVLKRAAMDCEKLYLPRKKLRDKRAQARKNLEKELAALRGCDTSEKTMPKSRGSYSSRTGEKS